MTSARSRIEHIYCEAVAAVDPRTRVRGALEFDGSTGKLEVGGVPIEVRGQGVSLIAIGKAGAAMAGGALDALEGVVRAGVVVTKEPAGVDHPRIGVMQGAHPVPDQRSLDAGRSVLEFAASVPEGDVVLCLISGGGSALVEALREGVSLDDLQRLTRSLLSAGASITELNAVRSRMSRIKGGGLLSALGHARVVNLIVSDVLGDDLQTIASGPTVPQAAGLAPEDVLLRYGIDAALPDSPPAITQGPVATRIVANLDIAIDAATEAARSLSLKPVVLARRVEGEAREVGGFVGSTLVNHRDPSAAIRSGSCLIAGGETTVTVRGSGEGGRNTEAALASALRLAGKSGATVGFLATDGDDGTTGAAGGIVDGATIPVEAIRQARAALDDNDSYGYLSATGAIWSPGATGTNVNDLVIGIVE